MAQCHGKYGSSLTPSVAIQAPDLGCLAILGLGFRWLLAKSPFFNGKTHGKMGQLWENHRKTIRKLTFSWEWDLPSGIVPEILALWGFNGNLMVSFRSKSTIKR